jgi:Arc/MetJ-type ribon-helix-helix transcriptional regulator
MKEQNLRITIRIERKLRQQINKALNEGRASSISELVRKSIAFFLKEGRNDATE